MEYLIPLSDTFEINTNCIFLKVNYVLCDWWDLKNGTVELLILWKECMIRPVNICPEGWPFGSVRGYFCWICLECS